LAECGTHLVTRPTVVLRVLRSHSTIQPVRSPQMAIYTIDNRLSTKSRGHPELRAAAKTVTQDAIPAAATRLRRQRSVK